MYIVTVKTGWRGWCVCTGALPLEVRASAATLLRARRHGEADGNEGATAVV